MNITLIHPTELSKTQADAWRHLTSADATYDSPFYAPAFILAVAKSRTDVEIAIAQEHGDHVAFFPFQRSSGRGGRPVGYRINDFQGAVVATDARIDVNELLRACRLSQWRFDHVPVSQRWCGDAQINFADSPYIETSDGFESYLAIKKFTGDSRLKTVMRKSRKLQREIGPLRFEFHDTDPAAFDCLMRWKTAQLRRMHTYNILAQPWVKKTIACLRGVEDPDCRPALSTLYSGDTLVAAHLGIYNDRVMHWWLTTYNQEFERYSPGAVLLLRMVEECAARGIGRIDLGKGAEAYKRHFMTSATPLAEGAIAVGSWRQAGQRVAYRVAQTIRNSTWMNPPAQWVKRMRRSLAGN